jgi:hypothetical protein
MQRDAEEPKGAPGAKLPAFPLFYFASLQPERFLCRIVPMRKPYKPPAIRALPDLKVPEPRISKFVILIARLLGRLYLFLCCGVSKIVVQDGAPLFDAFRRALAGESRCIIAFRHPDGSEPQILAWFFLFKLRRLAARQGVRFARRPHGVFVYGYEVVRWGGWVIRAVMPRLGALPVHHAKMDSRGMARIYKAVLEGPYPLALAPEGQVSYTAGSVPRLEPGVIRIGFGAAEKLAKAPGNPVPVEILPLSFQFRFGPRRESAMERLLGRIERYAGIPRREAKKRSLRERLGICREHILEVNEQRYGLKPADALSFEERLDLVIAAALDAAERILGQKSGGDLFTRMYHLRQICWDRLILPGMESLDHLTGVRRGTADLAAGEAWYAGRHLELVDFSWYFRRPLPEEDAPLDQRIEYVQNLWDFASRTMGGAFTERKRICPRKVIIRTALPINLTGRLLDYKHDRKSAIHAAMEDLMKAYIDCGSTGEADATGAARL